MHPLLKRQLIHNNIDPEQPPEAIISLLEAVSDTYFQNDRDRKLLEHSLKLTSEELVEQNRRLQRELERLNQTDEALRRSEERYQLAVEGSNVGIWDWDIRSGRTFYSPAVSEILGYRNPDWSQRHGGWLDHVVKEDRRGLMSAMKSHLIGHNEYFRHEYRVLRHDGEIRWVLTRGMALRDHRNHPYRIAGSIEDITQRKEVEQQARHDAIHDALTGLPNRVLLLDRLQHLIRYARRHPEYRFALLFIDLDRFKLVNDSFGHLAGDALLKEIATRFKACIKDTDTLARMGGDEFIVLLEEIGDEQMAVEVAERLQQQLKLPIRIEDQEIYSSASIGIVMNDQGHKDASELLRDADTAMYRAKLKGKDQCKLFRQEMHQQASSRLRLEGELRQALEKNQLRLMYQPVVRLPGLQLHGFEALVRWLHPQQGLLSPVEFLHVAEEIGLQTRIDLWVQSEACRQLKQWKQTFPQAVDLHINTNVSPALLEHPEFARRTEQLLSELQLAPNRLQLEITEHCLIQEGNSRVLERLHQLKEIGTTLYLDDFGTGYASLSYLHRLPFDGVKIDRSLIGLTGQSGRTDRFVKAILEMTQSLNLQAVAEGIEDAKQLKILNRLPCRYGQGYHFSKPLDSDAAEQYMLRLWRRQRRPG